MASSVCAECGHPVAGGDERCEGCGAGVEHETDRTRRVLLKVYNVGCLLILALLAIAFVAWLVRTFM